MIDQIRWLLRGKYRPHLLVACAGGIERTFTATAERCLLTYPEARTSALSRTKFELCRAGWILDAGGWRKNYLVVDWAFVSVASDWLEDHSLPRIDAVLRRAIGASFLPLPAPKLCDLVGVLTSLDLSEVTC